MFPRPAQNGTLEMEIAVDSFLENGSWEHFDPDSLSGEPIMRVRIYAGTGREAFQVVLD